MQTTIKLDERLGVTVLHDAENNAIIHLPDKDALNALRWECLALTADISAHNLRAAAARPVDPS
jgi:hypothetical protein